jgi:hypothetical protein
LNALLILLLVAVAVGAIAAVVFAVRAASGSRTPDGESMRSESRPRPVLADFHVTGSEANVCYDVPLPEGPAGSRLRDILSRDAVDVLREKREHGLPIDQVDHIRVCAMRDGEVAELAVVDLPEAGQLPELVAPELVPHAPVSGYDPLARLDKEKFRVDAGVDASSKAEGLPPFAEELHIPESVEAELRALGTDPREVTLNDLALDLLRIGGYQVSVDRLGLMTLGGGAADVYHATKDGVRWLVVVVGHSSGEYPELSEGDINAMLIAVGRDNPDRALLVTDKFGPYIMYEKEKRDPRCRFITRERLQVFVDSFALS